MTPPEPPSVQGPEPAGAAEPSEPGRARVRHTGVVDRFLRPRARPRFEIPPEGAEPPLRDPADWPGRAHPVQQGFLLAIGVGLALVCWWVLANIGPVLGWVVAATFVALGLEPLVRWLESRSLPRPGAVALVVLALAGALAALIALVVPRVVTEAAQLAESVPRLIDSALDSPVFDELDARFGIQESTELWLQSLAGRTSGDGAALGGIFGGVVGLGTVVIEAVTGTLIVLALTLYFLASLPLITRWAYRLAPASRRARAQELGEQMLRTVGNYVVGQMCVALLNATVALVLMTLTGVPFPALLCLLVAMLAFVPLVGGVAAGVLVSLVALTEGLGTAVPYAIGYFTYLQIEAYFVSPRIMHRAVAVPGAVAVIAVAAGGVLWGVLGALIAIPTAAVGMLLVREIFVPRQDAR